jgi:diguanylate cyclase (GGDEF)-like protein
MNIHRIFDRRRLILLLWVLLTAGFMATSLIGYQVSRQAIRNAIVGQDLPLTSSNIYFDIQKDLVRPVLIASTMAHDTFLRDWLLNGENNVDEITHYLKVTREQQGAFSSFLVSDRTAIYYTGDGFLKHVSPTEPRDAWYYRVRDMKEDYEINVDPDLANHDAMTIFINHRVLDFAGNYIGATGIGLTVEAVHRLIGEYQQRYQRSIYFIDSQGKPVTFGSPGLVPDLRAMPGLGPLIDRILSEKNGSYQYEVEGDNHILRVNYVPELKWLLFVDQSEAVALAGIRQTLYINLAISLAVTFIVVFLTRLALVREQRNLEEMASTDKVTGLLNRHAFTILIGKLMAENRREPRPISMLLADIDHFKDINDRHGHAVGDAVLAGVARLLLEALREADIAVRWGGEEFLLVLKGCDLAEAQRIAEILRRRVAAAPVMAEGLRIAVTISIGVTEYDDGEPADRTVSRADAAMYQAKREGRNRVSVAEKYGIDPSQAPSSASSL